MYLLALIPIDEQGQPVPTAQVWSCAKDCGHALAPIAGRPAEAYEFSEEEQRMIGEIFREAESRRIA